MKSQLIVFERAKVLSIDVPIKRALEFHESGSVAPQFGRVLLPMNIIEAMVEDVRLGHLHYMGFGRIDLARQGRDAIDWHDEALTKLWSSVNRESAEKYSEAVRQLEEAEFRHSTFPG